MVKNNSHQKGQILIEAVLLLVIFAGMWIGISNKIKNEKWMSKLIENGPWPKLSGMIENGVWQTPQAGKVLHPNNLGRSASKKEP